MYLSAYVNNERNQCGVVPFDVNQMASVRVTSPLASIAFCRVCSYPLCRKGVRYRRISMGETHEVKRILVRVPRSAVCLANAMGQISSYTTIPYGKWSEQPNFQGVYTPYLYSACLLLSPVSNLRTQTYLEQFHDKLH